MKHSTDWPGGDGEERSQQSPDQTHKNRRLLDLIFVHFLQTQLLLTA